MGLSAPDPFEKFCKIRPLYRTDHFSHPAVTAVFISLSLSLSLSLCTDSFFGIFNCYVSVIGFFA